MKLLEFFMNTLSLSKRNDVKTLNLVPPNTYQLILMVTEILKPPVSLNDEDDTFGVNYDL